MGLRGDVPLRVPEGRHGRVNVAVGPDHHGGRHRLNPIPVRVRLDGGQVREGQHLHLGVVRVLRALCGLLLYHRAVDGIPIRGLGAVHQ